jgi:hypothetical protein
MALIGHTAASMNIFLDIPIVIRAVSQSLSREVGPDMRIGVQFLEEIKRVDPKDPTGIYEEYYGDWWNFENEWKTHPVEVNQGNAFKWHIVKVNENFTRVPLLTLLPIGSTGEFAETKCPFPSMDWHHPRTRWSAIANRKFAKHDSTVFWVKYKRRIRL